MEILGTINEQTGAHKEAADNYEKAWKYSRKNQPSIGMKESMMMKRNELAKESNVQTDTYLAS